VKALKKLGHKPVPADSCIIKLDDKPGELARITEMLANEGISIFNMSLIDRKGTCAYVLLATSNSHKTKELLREYLEE